MKTTQVATVTLRKLSSRPDSLIPLADLTAQAAAPPIVVTAPFGEHPEQSPAGARPVLDRAKSRPTRVRAHGFLLDESFEQDIAEMEAGHRFEGLVLIILACSGLGGLAACATSLWRYLH